MKLTSEVIFPTPEELKEWEHGFFDQEKDLSLMLVQAYQAGYWRCQGEYELASLDLVWPPDNLVEPDDD